MANKLFVANLSWDLTSDQLRDLFAEAGNVLSANIISDKFTGKSKGFGFVEMSSDSEAQEAVQKLNGRNIDGRDIVVNEARPQAPRENSFGGSSGGYSQRRDNSRGGDSRFGGQGNKGKRRY
ncbi:MAG: RNA-binding protein [Candidatus Daviesbacteria bacterium]|nr:RNA-binding protein [Candidatus Daviesbacteria bacterium]